MALLSAISIITSLLIAIALFLTGRFLSQLQSSTISIAKELPVIPASPEQEQIINGNAQPGEVTISTPNEKWANYAIRLSFTEKLSAIGVLLMIIGILYIVSALATWGMMASFR